MYIKFNIIQCWISVALRWACEMKMNKGNLFQNGVRKPWRENSSTFPLLEAYIHQQEVRRFPLSLATATSLRLQPMRSHYHFELSFSSNELLFKATPSVFLLSSVKGCSVFSSLVNGSAIVCMSWIAIPLLFLNKLIGCLILFV